MSAEIKPGQIWQWNSALPGEPDLTVTKVEGDRVSYQYQYDAVQEGRAMDVGLMYDSIEAHPQAPLDPILLPWIIECYRDVDHFTERAHLVKDVGTTPAPLDPAAVKAGDTVEAVVTPVGHAPEYIVKGGVWESSAGALYVGPVELASPRVSLLSHQPAPAPEWKPGAFVKATSQRGAEVRGFIQEDGGLAFFDPEEGASYESHNYFNVRPLVVIDPADVDVDALVETACYAVDRWLPAGVATPATAAIRDAVHGVLRHIGIEVPR